MASGILRRVATVHLGLGSNLGDRLTTLRRAVDELSNVGELLAASSIYETAPFGVTAQPSFLNSCVAIETRLTPREVLERTRAIEKALGRVDGPRWGPRGIDVDLLLYGDAILTEPDLVVPHPGLLERAFVLVPLAEIASDRVIPSTGLTVADALARVARHPGDVRRAAAPPTRRGAR
jgi:2-amino-4-hydroxy-6-hydroxymethyldihydropteridine diphosphokinase